MKTNYKRFFISAVAIAAALTMISCSTDSGDDDVETVTSSAYSEPSNIASCTEYIYDKEIFTDYARISNYDSDGVELSQVQYFFYNAEEVNDCTFVATSTFAGSSGTSLSISTTVTKDWEKTIKARIASAFSDGTFSYDKTTRCGNYISVLFSVLKSTDESGNIVYTYTPEEESRYYTEYSDGELVTCIAVSFDIDDSGSLTEACDIVFNGNVTADGATYTKTDLTGSEEKYTKLRIEFNPSDSCAVKYLKISDYDTTKLTRFPVTETEYSTYNLSVVTGSYNYSMNEIVGGNFKFTLSSPVSSVNFAYKEEIPDSISVHYSNIDLEQWYQVNRTINFFNTSGEITQTLYTLYMLSWDTNIYSDYFIRQTEYNTDANFTTPGEIIKTISVITDNNTDKRIRAYLYIYGETTQRKVHFSYATYPSIDTSANEYAANYTLAGQSYCCGRETYERVSTTSLDLKKTGKETVSYYVYYGALCVRNVEYTSSSVTVDTSSGDSSSGDDDLLKSSTSFRNLVMR